MTFKETYKNIKSFIIMIYNISHNLVYVGIIKALSGAVLPYINVVYYAMIIDELISGNYQKAINYVIIMLSLTFILSVINRASMQYCEGRCETIHEDVLNKTVYKSYIMEYDFFEKKETMEAIARAKNGSNSSGGCDAQYRTILVLLEEGIKVVFAAIIFSFMLKDIFYLQTVDAYQLVLLGCLVIVIVCGFNLVLKLSKKSGELLNNMLTSNEKGNAESAYLFSILNKTEYGKDIRVFKMKNMLINIIKERVLTVIIKFTQFSKNDGKISAKYEGVYSTVSCVVYIFICYQAINGLIGIGSVLKYAQNIIILFASIGTLAQHYQSVAFTSVYLSNFEKFINYKNKHFNGTIPTEKRLDNNYVFEFVNVSFKYPDTDNMVLDNVNLKFEVGKKMAIIGQNGAGKTTVVKLLCRLYEPTSGQILLNGIDITKYDYKEYMDLFAVVFQDFQLFSLPIDQNISCTINPDYAKLETVLKQVGIYETLMSLPNQLKTFLNKDLEEGIVLSGGQAQKVAIARALYKNAPFVILDEPTSALDPISEAAIYDNFNEMVKNKTAIYISHRMSSCKFCDEIVVFENGKIIEKGCHSDLLKQAGLYKSLWDAQAQYYV